MARSLDICRRESTACIPESRYHVLIPVPGFGWYDEEIDDDTGISVVDCFFWLGFMILVDGFSVGRRLPSVSRVSLCGSSSSDCRTVNRSVAVRHPSFHLMPKQTSVRLYYQRVRESASSINGCQKHSSLAVAFQKAGRRVSASSWETLVMVCERALYKRAVESKRVEEEISDVTGRNQVVRWK